MKYSTATVAMEEIISSWVSGGAQIIGGAAAIDEEEVIPCDDDESLWLLEILDDSVVDVA